jgi:hypothetical protein
MSQSICSQCGADIDGTGIRHRGRLFCSDECCETYEEEFLTKGEPGLDELDGDLDEELEFDEDDLEDEELEEDDDFDVDEDDDN